MSTDGSVSEDVSSAGALSHCHASLECNIGEGSETSLVSSSEGTVPGPVRLAERLIHNSQTLGGLVDIPPVCDKISTLCLSTEETFGAGKKLPFINPSSLETLSALVQEIQSNGEIDGEMWKDCESRWLHLFQLVEKQYQEQILAQQEQYQCQIQLIQDEIKALVQLQNRQNSGPANSLPEFPSTPLTAISISTKDDATLPLMANNPSAQTDLLQINGSLSAPATISHTSSSLPPPQPEITNPRESVGAHVLTVLSSGYGTLSPRETDSEQTDTRGKRKTALGEEANRMHAKQEKAEATLSCLNTLQTEVSIPHKITTGCSNQPLTNWAQRPKLKPKKIKADQISTAQGLLASSRKSHRDSPLEPTDFQDQHGSSALLSSSPVSEASGLTYWRMDESDLYHPLPNSFDSGTYVLMKDASVCLTSSEEPRLNLKEIYLSKLKTDSRCRDWDGSPPSSPLSPQAFSLDPTVHKRQSDRTSGFTSPSHFSSPSFPTQPLLDPHMGMTPSPCSNAEDGPPMDIAASLGDPVVLSLLRQNLREKHSRHVADLKAYYEAEIRTVREQLNLCHQPLDLEKSNCELQDRCDHLERALNEASRRIQELETKNTLLERKLASWAEQYEVAGAAVTTLQQRLEESKRSGSEKDAFQSRLRIRIQQLEQQLNAACQSADEKEAKEKMEYKMLQDLLGEYDLLRKEFEAMKDTLMAKENKLFSANEEISELKRVIFKLESQVKQLEHENKSKARYAPHNHSQPSGAGLYHHPDLLLSPSKCLPEPEPTYRHSQCPQTNPLVGCWELSFPEMDHSKGQNDQSPRTQMDQSARSSCPSEREWCPPDVQHREQAGGSRESEGTRAAESKNGSALNRLAGRKNTVDFVHQSPKGLVKEGGVSTLDWAITGIDRTGPATTMSLGGASERSAATLWPQQSPSPGHPAHRTFPPATPTKRETLLAPFSAKSSPKRCPTDNYSTAFDLAIPQRQNLHKCDMSRDQPQHSFHSASPRKGLHFKEQERREGPQQSDNVSGNSPGSKTRSRGDLERCWKEQGTKCYGPDPQDTVEEVAPSFQARLHSLADAEKLFDELTQEKQQIEASLSRMPRAGVRVSLQARLDEVALENRLERVNCDLGSIRMSLKRFHVLRSSVNI